MIFLYRIWFLLRLVSMSSSLLQKIAFHMKNLQEAKKKKIVISIVCACTWRNFEQTTKFRIYYQTHIMQSISAMFFPFFLSSTTHRNLTVWKLERYIKVQHLLATKWWEEMRRKEMQERSLSIYFYLSRFMHCNSTSSSTFIAFCLKSLTRCWWRYRTTLQYVLCGLM